MPSRMPSPIHASSFASAALLLLATGCLTPKPLDDAAADDTGASSEAGPSVYDVNDGTAPQDVVVTLSGVVVTSPITRDGEGFFIADPDGGPGSGLYVWREAGMEGLDVYPGDELRITGTPTEFYGWMELVVDGLDDIEVTGEADMPAPVELADGAGVDWEAYESVVVTIETQAILGVDQFNTATLSGGILLDDGFEYLEYDCRGAFASITGVVFYQYEAHAINPRNEADLGLYTAPEPLAASISAIRTWSMCGPVTLSGVVATTPDVVDEGDTLFFVQDAGGGQATGVAAFAPGASFDVAIGDVLTLTGSADQFYGYTQIYISDVTTAEVTGSGGIPVGQSLTEAPVDWEAYEGALITLADVLVTSEPSFGEVTTNYGIKLDTLYHEHNAELDDTFATVTGVVYYSYSEWKLEPRDAADLVP